jgi:hypothetical protein
VKQVSNRFAADSPRQAPDRTAATAVGAVLRIYFMQQRFNLSDPAMEDALYDNRGTRTVPSSLPSTGCARIIATLVPEPYRDGDIRHA